MLEGFQLIPQYRSYVWGGQKLRPGISPTAEAWVIYEQDRIAGGPLAGRSLADAAAELGETLLGKRAVERTGLRFPLLVKLLDCAAWLSLQVHPDNAQAARLEGPGQFGKAEAWHILEAYPGAELLCGLRPGVDAAGLEQAVRSGTLLERMQRLNVRSGDTIFIRPGTIHALGPGLLVYEVQQTSDITYRVWDWDRPATEGRKLHIAQSLAVADPGSTGQALPLPAGEGLHRLISSEFFNLDLLNLRSGELTLDTAGQSFHALTVTAGRAKVGGTGWSLELGRLETALAPANSGPYRVETQEELRLLIASVA
ncbi:MAG TPA: type I phosphomannose isomerase catalytic subunit [Anaerolineales bacterium]